MHLPGLGLPSIGPSHPESYLRQTQYQNKKKKKRRRTGNMSTNSKYIWGEKRTGDPKIPKPEERKRLRQKYPNRGEERSEEMKSEDGLMTCLHARSTTAHRTHGVQAGS